MGQAAVPMNEPLRGRPKVVLLGEQTVSTLLTNIGRVYRHHLGVIFGCAVLPFVPAAIAMAFLPVLGIWVFDVAIFLVPAALTVALSDICLGNQPKVTRAFARILRQRRWWQLITTMVLVEVAMVLGLICLILPFFWVFIRSVFAATIVTLEGRRNRDAIRRSFALTKGQAWRITGLILLPTMLAEIAIVLLVIIAIMVAVALGASMPGPDSALLRYGMVPIVLLAYSLLLPAGAMSVVLLYYDQRVRREGYDAQSLSEDLMR